MLGMQYQIRHSPFFLRSEGSCVGVRTVARQLPCRDKSVLLEQYVVSLSNAEPVQQPAAGGSRRHARGLQGLSLQFEAGGVSAMERVTPGRHLLFLDLVF